MDSLGRMSLRASLSIPGIADQLATLAFDYRFSREMWMVSLVLVVYDYILTFNDEVTFLWNGKLNWARVLFFLCRYWPGMNLVLDNVVLAWNHPPSRVCFIWYNWIIYSGVVSRLVVAMILLLRIHAIYEQNKRLILGLSFFLSLALVTEVVIAGVASAQLQSIPLPDGFSGCAPTNIPPYAWSFWLPMMLFEFSLVLLVVVKWIRLSRSGVSAQNMMLILLRDSVIFFGAALAVILTNCIIWAKQDLSLFAAFPSALFAVQSILGCRMLLNIQQAANPWLSDQTSVSDGTTAATELQFASITRDLESIPLDLILNGGGESNGCAYIGI